MDILYYIPLYSCHIASAWAAMILFCMDLFYLDFAEGSWELYYKEMIIVMVPLSNNILGSLLHLVGCSLLLLWTQIACRCPGFFVRDSSQPRLAHFLTPFRMGVSLQYM